MAGSVVTGALSMAVGASSPAPHGGIWVIGLVGNPLLWAASIAAGVVISTGCVVVAKHLGGRQAAIQSEERRVSAPAALAAR
jgi:PTS system fructose-specific IIC component